MKNNTVQAVIRMGVLLLMLTGLTACGQQSAAEETAKTGFAPQLDTKQSVSLEISSFLGNFEGLDQVINAFNTYYPQVTVSYEQVGGDHMAAYLQSNPNVDILMTDDSNFRYPDWTDFYILDDCADLRETGIDFSAVQDALLDACTVDGKLVRLPLGRSLTGVAVNLTLLEQNGLTVPRNYGEFLQVLEALREKGYTPIQGASSSAGANLVYSTGMTLLGTQPGLLDALNAGDETAVEQLLPVYEKLEALTENGYIRDDVNSEYPQDNYDGAILRFFEGDVPFWTCSTEKFSGMKKRESKSDAFREHPFSYAFMDVPLEETGADQYEEPWFGFSVNKNSDAYDYAVEFLRFLATEEQLNTIAEVKGVPSATKESRQERYEIVRSQEQAAGQYVNTGALLNHVREFFCTDANNLVSGEFPDAEAAIRDYVRRCAEIAAQMAERQADEVSASET